MQGTDFGAYLDDLGLGPGLGPGLPDLGPDLFRRGLTFSRRAARGVKQGEQTPSLNERGQQGAAGKREVRKGEVLKSAPQGAVQQGAATRPPSLTSGQALRQASLTLALAPP